MSKKILVIGGSNREDSISRKVTNAFKSLAGDDIEFIIADISKLPLFNQDLEAEGPEYLKDWKEQINNADAILFITPEHNRSIPAALKNAIDWASRPYPDNAWAGKPTAIAGCSPSPFGAFGAVQDLRKLASFLNMFVLPQPEFYLAQAHTKFNEEGELIDKNTEEYIINFWRAFKEWIEKVM